MILVFGSLNVDFVMQVERLPAPGETVLGGDYFLVPGGKGANQALAAARARDPAAGGAVAMQGCVGTDDWGRFAVSLLAEAGVDLHDLQSGNAATGCASILVDRKGENCIAVASGANMEAAASAVDDSLLGPDSWLLLQMEVRPEENWALLERAKSRGAKVVLNVAPAAPVPSAALRLIDVLVVNEVEAGMVAEAEGLAGGDVPSLCAMLAGAHDLLCVATLGSKGAIAIGPEGGWAVDPLAVTVVDTTGAGDAFVGCLAAALDGGEAIPEALRWASVGAGLCCARAGTQSSFAHDKEIIDALTGVAPARPLD